MGKYGSGVGMKDVIEMEMQEAKGIMEKNKLTEEDQKALTDIIQEMAYQWCVSNASACAYEQCVPHRGNPLKLVASRKYQDIYNKKMNETFPW